MEIKLSDGRESLWQWDTGRYVTVTGTDATELHLSRGGARSAHVIEIVDGKAEIPDHMLLKDGELVAYVMERDAGGGMTTYKSKFVVQARQRPEGYVYPPVRRWEELENRMEEIEKNSTNDHEKLLNRDTDDQHPISAITGLTTALNNNSSAASEAMGAAQDAGSAALAAMQAAQEAGGAAGAAQKTADDAVSAAGKAQSTADAANATAEGLDSRITAAEEELTQKQPKGEYLTSETDPTVPTWAKQPQKPTYTATEVGALPSDTKIPSKVSELENDEKYAKTSELPQIDATLKQSGQAADAKVVGDWLKKIESSALTSAQVLDALFRLPRNGKVYTVKIPKFAANQSTTCTKLDDNANLVCEASTDTVAGQDDYADIPLFRWYNCNYLRDGKGHAYPTAIEGIDSDYTTTGSVDVGVIQMAPYIKWDNTNDEYTILSITDTPRDGYTLWCEAISDGAEYPYVIHSKYISGIASDGLLRSQPGLAPARDQSYNNMITNYAKKGDGYFGAPEARNTWQIIFTLIKYAKKSSQEVFTGCSNYSFQYAASVEQTTEETYFPVTKAQAANIIVGGCVSVGYGSNNNGAVNSNRSVTTMHAYADDVKVIKIVDLDDSNSAVYLDITNGFATTPIALTDELNAPITLTSMHWQAGSTESVVGHHDGSLGSNTNGKYPYRVQGLEYMVGGYTISSDVVMDIQSDYSKNVLVCPAGQKRLSADATIRQSYTNVGIMPGNNGDDYWIGDIDLDVSTGVTWPSSVGSGSVTGIGDRCYNGGKNTNQTRENLKCGTFGNGSSCGSSCVTCGNGLGRAYWDALSAD